MSKITDMPEQTEKQKPPQLPTTQPKPPHESRETPPVHQVTDPDAHDERLLSTSVRRRPGPDDDSLTERAVFSRFDQLENSIATFALTYFQNISREVKDKDTELVVMVPGYEALLRERRTGFLVVRAVVARVLAKEGFGLEGVFLGEGWRGLMGAFQKGEFFVLLRGVFQCIIG